MSHNQTVTIGGRQYDAHTGLSMEPVHQTGETPHAARVHKPLQRSHTLSRAHTKRPATSTSHVSLPSPAYQVRRAVPQSPAITKFAPTTTAPKRSSPVMDIRPARTHPLVTKVEARRQPVAKNVTVQVKPSDVIKQEAIATVLEKAPSHASGAHQIKKQGSVRRRTFSLIAGSLALIILAGYVTYLNMPSLSVRVAAAQAGINASYPQYHPDGYSLHGAITYKDGEVAMNFSSNGGPQNFSLTQAKSTWDSSAVQAFVAHKTNGQYLTNTQNGLTIYTYGGNAAWVSGGILYMISGDAPLTSDQIDRIATSM